MSLNKSGYFLRGVFVVIAIVAVALGITLRKAKNTKAAVEIAEDVETVEATADTTNE